MNTKTNRHERTNSYPDNAAAKQLRDLGLLDAAVRYGVTTTGKKWIVPSYDPITGALSSRNRVRTVNKKTFWNGDKSIPVNLISGLPGWKQAVTAADGVVYLAAGEKDYLAYLAAGLFNTLLLFQEIPNRDTLKAILADANINSVIYPHDCDDTGRKGAAAVRDVCTELGIHFEAKQLPFDPDSKKDLFDFWALDRGGDLRARLEGLPESDLPLPEPQPNYTAQKTYTGDGAQLWERWLNEVAKPALDAYAPIVKPYKGDGWRRVRPDDNDPSFRISYDQNPLGVPMDKHGAQSWDETAQQIGATPFKDWIKSQGIEPRQKSKQTKPAKQKATPTQPVKPTGKRASRLRDAVQVHGRYMSDVAAAVPDKGVIIYRGDMGNGKTHYIVHHALKGVNRSLYIAPFTKPIDNLCETANQAGITVHNHGDVRKEHASSDLRSFSHLATTPYQLWRLLDPETGRVQVPDLLVIDEAMMSLLSSFYNSETIWSQSGAMKEPHKKQSLAVLEYLIKNTPQVMILDAFVNNALVEHIKAIRGAGDVTVIENTFARKRGNKIIYKHPDTALDTTVRDWLQRGGLAAYCHTSVTQANETFDLLTTQYGIDADSILTITGETSGTGAAKQFAKNPDGYLSEHPEIHHLIYTSALGVGFSIETLFSVLFGCYRKNPLNHIANLQMENRVRNVSQYHVYVEPNRKDKQPESAQAIYEFELGRAKSTAGIAAFDANGIAVIEAWQDKLLRMQSTFQAIENVETNRFRDSYIRDSEGHSLIRFNGDTDGISTIKDAREHLGATRQKREIEGVLAADPVDSQTYAKIAQRGETTQEIIHGYLRWKIEGALGRGDLTERDVTRYRSGNERSALSRFVDVRHEATETLQAMDRKQAAGSVNSRQHRTLNAVTLRTFTRTLYNGNQVSPEIEFERDEIEAATNEFVATFPDWKQRFGIRSDKSISLMSIARRLFKIMGLKLVSRNTTGAGGAQRRVYRLDNDTYQETVTNGATAYQARLEHRQETNEPPPRLDTGKNYKNGNSILLPPSIPDYLPDISPPDIAYRNQVMANLELI